MSKTVPLDGMIKKAVTITKGYVDRLNRLSFFAIKQAVAGSIKELCPKATGLAGFET
jgi:hypothetical protein